MIKYNSVVAMRRKRREVSKVRKMEGETETKREIEDRKDGWMDVIKNGMEWKGTEEETSKVTMSCEFAM